MLSMALPTTCMAPSGSAMVIDAEAPAGTSEIAGSDVSPRPLVVSPWDVGTEPSRTPAPSLPSWAKYATTMCMTSNVLTIGDGGCRKAPKSAKRCSGMRSNSRSAALSCAFARARLAAKHASTRATRASSSCFRCVVFPDVSLATARSLPTRATREVSRTHSPTSSRSETRASRSSLSKELLFSRNRSTEAMACEVVAEEFKATAVSCRARRTMACKNCAKR
mmetsp:Transcript_47992/g.153430  ORF Transcript_47992/g.153430 Transcript_47992/m.153430 type:complete len:222 (+) Transcript_47992:2460-3125(+)